MRFLSFLFVLCAFNFVGAQSLDAYQKAADKAYATGDYFTAMSHYAKILKQKPKEDTLWIRYAECAQAFNGFQEAEKVLLRLYNKKKKVETYPILPFRLAQAYRSQGKYEKALVLYDEFIQANQGTKADHETAKREKKAVEIALEIQKNTIEQRYSVKHENRNINSPYSDFGVAKIGDTLYFSSYKFDKKGENSKEKQAKIVSSIKNRKAQPTRKMFPSFPEGHVAHPTFSPDGSFVFFNKCKNLPQGGIQCKLWMMAKNAKGKWLEAIELPAPYNLENTTTTQAQVAFDATTREINLFFASDRAGGIGGLDLWKIALDTAFFCPCTHAQESKKTKTITTTDQKAENLRALNTSEDEATPFYVPETSTLWFASKGHAGMGGYDLFLSKKNNETWEEATNAGAQLNTAYNDLYPSLSADGKSGYLSSNRPGAYYLDNKSKACCNDIFSFQILENEIITPNPPLPDRVDIPNIPPQAPLTTSESTPVPPSNFEPPKFADFKGLPLYFDNDEPDKRTRSTTTKKIYGETALTYLDREETYRKEYGKGLSEHDRADAEADIQDFFYNEVQTGYDQLERLTELLLMRLEQGEKVEIFLKGFTSPRAKSDYNLNLGKRRVSSLRNHFEEWSDGALQPYFSSNKLKITETSFGETTANKSVSDRLEDRRNSIYSPAAARERRVEIVEIKIK